MKFITLTTCQDKKPILLNVKMIGSLKQYENYTLVQHLVHNNGGYHVTQDVNEILDLIND